MDKKKEAPLTIRFKDFYSDVNGVTYFKIVVHDTQNMWEFDERYSSMRDIHKQLKESYKGELPDFPTKKWFGNTDKNFLSQRKATLQTYFTNILNHMDISKYSILMNFFYRKGAKSMKEEGVATGKQKEQAQKVDNNNNNAGDNSNIKKKEEININEKNGNQEKGVSEAQKQAKRGEVFAQAMSKINEKVQNRFITNLTDFSGQTDPVHEQKRSQINHIKFNLKSQLISNLSLPQKFVEQPDLMLQDNMNNNKISIAMDNLSNKLAASFSSNLQLYTKCSSDIIVGKSLNQEFSD